MITRKVRGGGEVAGGDGRCSGGLDMAGKKGSSICVLPMPRSRSGFRL